VLVDREFGGTGVTEDKSPTFIVPAADLTDEEARRLAAQASERAKAYLEKYKGQSFPEPPPKWWKEAACKGMDPEYFYAAKEERKAGGVEREVWVKRWRAAAVCWQCPVWKPCLQEGIREWDGVWGGMGPKARERLRISHGIARRSFYS